MGSFTGDNITRGILKQAGTSNDINKPKLKYRLGTLSNNLMVDVNRLSETQPSVKMHKLDGARGRG